MQNIITITAKNGQILTNSSNDSLKFETKAIEYSLSFDSEITVRFVLERNFNTEHYSAMVYIDSEPAYVCHSVFAEETTHKITDTGLKHYVGPNETVKAVRDTCPETGKFLVRFEDNCDYVTSNHYIGLVESDNKIDWNTRN